MKIFPILLIILTLHTLSGHYPVHAQQMQNEEHNLFLNPVDSEISESTTKTPSITPPQKNNKEVKDVLPSKLNKPTPKSISIDINTDLIKFGIISPTSPTIREIIVSLSGTTPYQILYIKKDNTFSNKNMTEIPDTSCDQGGCSEYVGSDWINTLTFGYGYSCNSDLCDLDIKNSLYRPFSYSFVSLYQGSIGTGNKRMIRIPIKVNVPGTQENGMYSNSLTIMSVPSL